MRIARCQEIEGRKLKLFKPARSFPLLQILQGYLHSKMPARLDPGVSVLQALIRVPSPAGTRRSLSIDPPQWRLRWLAGICRGDRWREAARSLHSILQ